MLEARRIATRPLPVVRGLRVSDLAVAVAADALARQGRLPLLVPVLTGDLGSQFAFERELAKEGHDRSSISGDDYEARVAAFAVDRRAAAAEMLAGLGVDADLGGADVGLAARTAFVTLYEQGMIELVDRVVAICPRCRSAVDAADRVDAEHEVELVTVRVDVDGPGDGLDVELVDVELLQGAVAVVVPEAHPAAGGTATVPLAGRRVPVVADPLRVAPGFVVPAHDADGLAIAQAAGLAAIAVLDDDGVVSIEGPLAGLGRYAARQEAQELLAAEGAIVATATSTEEVGRCGCCGTVLVPQLGRHWFLRSGDLEVAAADAVRHAEVVFQPPDAREAFLASAGIRREWCVSSRVEGGLELPAAVCLDCGKPAVEVTPSTSCSKCMGVLVGEGWSLEARFVAAAWGLAAAGWPRRRQVDPTTVVVVGEEDLAGWVLPSLAIAIRLTGAPFAGVVVHPSPDNLEWVDGEDRRVVRLALLTGDIDGARAALDPQGAVGEIDVDTAVAAGLAALDDGAPALAASLLSSALHAGVAPSRLAPLIQPILGD